MSGSSCSGSRYFLSFIDEHTDCIDVFPVIRKSDVHTQFKMDHAWLERKFDCTLKRVLSVTRGYYIGIKNYLQEKGIENGMLPSYYPNLNGMVEREIGGQLWNQPVPCLSMHPCPASSGLRQSTSLGT